MRQVNMILTDEEYEKLIVLCAKEQLATKKLVKPTTLAIRIIKEHLAKLNNQDNEHNIVMRSKSVIIPDFKKNSIPKIEPDSIPIVKEDNMSDNEVVNSFDSLNYDF